MHLNLWNLTALFMHQNGVHSTTYPIDYSEILNITIKILIAPTTECKLMAPDLTNQHKCLHIL